MAKHEGDTLHGYKVVGIKECSRCGETGYSNKTYGVRGIARIAGNLCVDCVEELTDDE